MATDPNEPDLERDPAADQAAAHAGEHLSSARHLITAISDDRRRLAQRFQSASPLASTAQAVCFGLLIAVPALGLWMPMVFGFVAVTFAFLGVELYFRHRLGMTIEWPAGGRSWFIIILMGLFTVGMTIASIVLVVTDHRAWVAAAAGLGFAGSLLLVESYDRAYAADLIGQVVPLSAEAGAAPGSGTGDVADAQQVRIAAALRPVASMRADALAAVLGHHPAPSHIEALARRGLVTVGAASSGSPLALTADGRREVDRRLSALRFAAG